MLKLTCTNCGKIFLSQVDKIDAVCPTCLYYATRKENYAALANYNDALKDLATRLDFLKDEGVIHEDAYQEAQLGLSYLQNAAH